MDKILLGCRGVSKRFGETQALRDVSVDIQSGRIHTILGENGSGKSTLAKVLCGVLPADNGEIRVGGQLIQGVPDPRMMLAHGVAIVLQEVLVVPNRSVLDNILLGQDGVFHRCMSVNEKTELARQTLAQLTDRSIALDRPAGELPLHEQQIVVIARGLARRPDVLILDEATAALDLADRGKLFDTLKAFCEAGSAVVFVSHRMPEIVELSDQVHVMQNGVLIAELEGADINPATLLAHLTQELVDV
ncbi:ATP-binding cassette domain-containing protein [Hoeflea prorocentri]|uniref:ATP-binding cassette domain-containing protein n=1 Tax=Hoeflea prorocentri TaxID=1922333 RepID=A0A9X3UMJ9_9HYPH|nr:ATP-binding cassette domain-containing protein [Hoeflea prorocentri]MCY6381949.1 ATP-binding cassette domain-containing protein [Hoeflea prorocentri]MDA5399749.1 ATP-binding cassette domain-containing protein [Hoeflea prorocentri]